jgi:hypothetical protein
VLDRRRRSAPPIRPNRTVHRASRSYGGRTPRHDRGRLSSATIERMRPRTSRNRNNLPGMGKEARGTRSRACRGHTPTQKEGGCGLCSNLLKWRGTRRGTGSRLARCGEIFLQSPSCAWGDSGCYVSQASSRLTMDAPPSSWWRLLSLPSTLPPPRRRAPSRPGRR